MRSRILAALALSAVAAFAQQVKVESGPIPPLAELIPADVIAYVRLEDPVNDFEKLMGSGDTWKAPQKSAARTRRAMDKGFKEADRNAGVEEGSMDSWMRSIGSIEVALFTLNWEGDEGLADSPPVPDLVAVFESSLAVEMYNEVSAMLVDRGMATRSERGDLVLGLGEAFSPTLAIYGNKVVLATTPERLDSVLKAAKGGATNTLAQSATFRATCGDGRGPRVGYMRFGALLELIRDRLSERTRKQMNDVIQPLGLTKIAGIGYREDGPNGVITAKADGPVTAFQLLKSKAGPPGLAAGMPADTGFCVSFSGDVGPHLRRIETFLTDKAQFPFAPTVGMGVRWLTGRLGVGTDVLLDPLKNGLVFGMVPDGAGRTSERNLVLVAGLDPADANDYIAAVRRAYEKSSKQETEESTVDGVRWIREKAAPPKEAREGFASTGDGGARAPSS
ncbi:MAG TPA: hypothetical protein VEI02_12175, partial [Planctomycetota bacterium]|nr:hypothetical protein [Planctomycetota bacterium]